MKRRRSTATSLGDQPTSMSPRACERPGCSDLGQPRFQVSGRHAPRLIYLCSLCFDSMPVDQLNDLFLRSAAHRRRLVDTVSNTKRPAHCSGD